MTKDTFYFSHDYNVRSDEKIKLLIRKHGMQGYGIFWAIVEDLYNNANALRTDYEGIAFDLRSDEKTVKSIINDFNLFVFDDEFFGSLSVERRLRERDEKSAKARLSAISRWSQNKTDANALRTECERNAIKERKGKENKEKKSNGVHKFTPPSLLDVQNFIEQQSYSVNADSFFNFYESKGWMIGKNKMKDWKSAVRTWNTKNKAELAARKDDRFISLDYDFDNLDNWKIIESENKLKPNHNVMAIEIRNGVNAGKFLDWETVSKSRKLRQFFEQFASSQIEGLSYFCKEKYGRRTN